MGHPNWPAVQRSKLKTWNSGGQTMGCQICQWKQVNEQDDFSSFHHGSTWFKTMFDHD